MLAKTWTTASPPLCQPVEQGAILSLNRLKLRYDADAGPFLGR
jgi:hypothetical protein